MHLMLISAYTRHNLVNGTNIVENCQMMFLGRSKMFGKIFLQVGMGPIHVRKIGKELGAQIHE